MDELLDVKVGDDVLWQKYAYGSVMSRIAKVTKVTPTGRIRIDGFSGQFDKFGKQMGVSGYSHRSYIRKATKEDFNKIDQNRTIQKALRIMRKFNSENLSYEIAKKIIELAETEESH